jgi:heme oxygenase
LDWKPQLQFQRTPMPPMDDLSGHSDAKPNHPSAPQGGVLLDSSSLRGRAHLRLRAATQALHGALDSSLAPSTLKVREGYVRYLRMNWPCAPIERDLEDAGVRVLLPDWEQRRRRYELARDLDSLGALGDLGADLEETAPLHRAPAPQRVDADIGAILGWAYVLEGSRLGAGLILRTVETVEDPGMLIATRFLRHGRGENFWASFKGALSQIDNDEDAIARACAGACAAFKCFAMS